MEDQGIRGIATLFNVSTSSISSFWELEGARREHIRPPLPGAVGLQYNLLPQVGIYAEPGLCHYFDNGSNVRNIFKDHPTNFSLRMGIRLNLASKK